MFNFKVIVLQAQTELWAQILRAKPYWSIFFENRKILRGFFNFGLFPNVKLQSYRSQSSERVEWAVNMIEKIYLSILMFFFRNLMWNFAFWSFSTVRLPGFDNLCCLGLIVWGIRTWDENPVDGIAWKKESTMCFNCPDNDGKIIPPGCRWNNSIHQVSELKD